jgi:hypothetical protein
MFDSHTKIVLLLRVTSIASSAKKFHDDVPPHFVANHTIYPLQIHQTIRRTFSDDDDVVWPYLEMKTKMMMMRSQIILLN